MRYVRWMSLVFIKYLEISNINYSEELKQDFLKYEKARQLGEYDSIRLDMNRVIYDYGISYHNYIYILKWYNKLVKKYL